jgi:hypothetical protein
VASPVTPSIPTFVAGGTFQSGAAALTVPWPTAQANDVALLIVLQLSDTTVTLSTSSGSGASNFVQIGSTVTFGTLSMAVFWSRASSSSPFSPVVAANANDSCAQIVTFRGCSQDGNPFDVSATSGTATASTSVSVTGATTLQKDDLVVAICGYDVSSSTPQSSGWTNANLANPALTKEVDNSTTLSGGFAVAVGGFAAGGACGTTTATLATSSNQANCCITLKPQWNVDATANKAWPNGPNEWAAMLTALSIASMTIADNYTCQDSGTPLADNGTGAISLPVQAGSSNVAYQQSLSGFSRKGVSFTLNAAGAFYNTTFPNPSTTSYYAVMLADITAIVAGLSVLIFGGSAGILVTMSTGGVLECQAWNGSAFNTSTGTQAMTSVGTVPIILQYDRTNLVTRIITPYEVITPTWQGALSSGDTILELGSTGGTPAFVAGGLAFFSGSSAEVALAVSQTLLTGLGYDTLWGVDVPMLTVLPDALDRSRALAVKYRDAMFGGTSVQIFPVPVVSPEDQAMLVVLPDALDRARSLAVEYREAQLGGYVAPIYPKGGTNEDQGALVVLPDPYDRPRALAAEYRDAQTGGTSVQIFPVTIVTPEDQAMLVVGQDISGHRERRRLQQYEYPSYFAPLYVPPAVGPENEASLTITPDPRGYPRTQHLMPSVFAPMPLVVTIPGFGPSGPVLVITLEYGQTEVTLEWATEVQKMWTGAEYRLAQLTGPRQLYKGVAQLVDGDQRDIRSSLIVNAATGSVFLIGLPYEEVAIASSSTGTTANVLSTQYLDWIEPGQRVICVGIDQQTTVTAVVQGYNATQIYLDTALGSVCGLPGSRLMPLMPVYLDAKQGFGRYPVGIEAWTVAARAALFGFCGDEAMGTGATLTTFNDAVLGTIPVWDHGLVNEGQNPDSISTLADLVDLGGIPAAKGSAPYVDYGRSIRFGSSSMADWQWLKLFLYTARGAQRTWLVTSGRNDLVYVSNVGATLVVSKDFGTTGFGNYMTYYNAGIGQRLALNNADGSVQYVNVTSAIDNGNGTCSLGLSAAPTGTILTISFLDLCRFEGDQFRIAFGKEGGDGPLFQLDAIARVVQQ